MIKNEKKINMEAKKVFEVTIGDLFWIVEPTREAVEAIMDEQGVSECVIQECYV